MLILAFDTTAARCAVAVWRDGHILAARAETMEQGQAEALVPMIQGTLADAAVDFEKLDRIAVTVGPGSFTGVRVGIATARALALAAQIPVVGVSTTEAIAMAVVTDSGVSSPIRILVAIDTKRGDLYAQLFDVTGQAVNNAVALAPDLLPAWIDPGPLIVAGDGATPAAAALGLRAIACEPNRLPEPAVIARLAAERAPSGAGPLPLYLRPPEATIPKDGGRLRP